MRCIVWPIAWPCSTKDGSISASRLKTLQSRVRQLDVTLAGGAAVPALRPRSWLELEQAGRTVRIIETDFKEGEIAERVRASLGEIERLSVEPMSLREILLALTVSFREQRQGAGR